MASADVAVEGGVVRQVMVVEDDPKLRVLLARVLRELEYSVKSVAYGPQALGLLRHDPPAAVLLGHAERKADTWELLDACQRQTTWANVPIALIPVSWRTPTDARQIWTETARLLGTVERLIEA
jgi:CheY-like chemotaxis protein